MTIYYTLYMWLWLSRITRTYYMGHWGHNNIMKVVTLIMFLRDPFQFHFHIYTIVQLMNRYIIEIGLIFENERDLSLYRDSVHNCWDLFHFHSVLNIGRGVTAIWPRDWRMAQKGHYGLFWYSIVDKSRSKHTN